MQRSYFGIKYSCMVRDNVCEFKYDSLESNVTIFDAILMFFIDKNANILRNRPKNVWYLKTSPPAVVRENIVKFQHRQVKVNV